VEHLVGPCQLTQLDSDRLLYPFVQRRCRLGVQQAEGDA
jgi:hypothetical protein